MATAEANYPGDTALTQTNLDGIASSSTWLSGWTSDAVVNTSTKALDYLVTGEFQVESAGLSAGLILVLAYASYDDTPTWPDIFSSGTEGTEGAATLHDTEIRDRLSVVASIVTDTSVSRKYHFNPVSICDVFGTPVPPTHWAIFVAQSSGAALETTGDPNKITVTPVKLTI